MYVQSHMEQSGKFSSPTDPPWKLLLNVSIQRSFTTLIIIFFVIHQLLLLYSYYVLWVITPCHLVGGYWHFGDMQWLFPRSCGIMFLWSVRTHLPRWHVIIQKSTTWTFITLNVSYLKHDFLTFSSLHIYVFLVSHHVYSLTPTLFEL